MLTREDINEPIADRTAGIGRQVRRVLNVIECDVAVFLVNKLEFNPGHAGPGLKRPPGQLLACIVQGGDIRLSICHPGSVSKLPGHDTPTDLIR